MRLFVFIWMVFLFSCQPSLKKQTPPDTLIDSKDAFLRNDNGTWKYKGSNYSGYIVEKKRERIVGKVPVINGKENGTATAWYENGSKKFERSYLNGDREGIHKGWHSNGSLAFEFFFHQDKYEGVQKSYYPDGKPWQVLNYTGGYEEGKQKTWNKEGRLINNFTVKNGKLYGVIGRYDCMSVME